MTRKINSFEGCSGQVRTFGTGTMYSLDILRQCDKRLKTKIQTVLGANSYICRSYRGKTGRRENNVNLLYGNAPFLNPLKTSKILWLSDYFRGYKNGRSAGNWLDHRLTYRHHNALQNNKPEHSYFYHYTNNEVFH